MEKTDSLLFFLFEQVFTRDFSSGHNIAGVKFYELVVMRRFVFPHVFPLFLTLLFFISLGIISRTWETRIQQS